jgi:hypothetical protein
VAIKRLQTLANATFWEKIGCFGLARFRYAPFGKMGRTPKRKAVGSNPAGDASSEESPKVMKKALELFPYTGGAFSSLPSATRFVGLADGWDERNEFAENALIIKGVRRIPKSQMN